MELYQLSKDAEQDLREVARYTLNKWGRDALDVYRKGLKETFQKIAQREITARQFSATFPQLLVTKYKHHYIFYLEGNVAGPVIIGVVHERRDIVNRLSERLD